MKFNFLELLVFFSRTTTNQNSGFDGFSKRPPWGSGLSVAELSLLRLEYGWSKIPDVRMDGNTFWVRMRGQVFSSDSSTTVLTHIKMHMW